MSVTDDEKLASQQIDDIIKQSADWRGQMLARLRTLITTADPAITEEVKWKKPSRPEGVAVWSRDGIVCVADLLKSAVRLTFFKGASIPDPHQLFNTRLDSKAVRAIDFHEGEQPNEAALQALILEAAKVNSDKK